MKDIGTYLGLRNFADSSYKSFRAETVIGLNITANSRVDIANLYRLKDIDGDLSLRNTADDTYLNFACNSISLGAETGLSLSGTGVIPGLNGVRTCRLPLFTTAERDGVLTPVTGDMIYNTTLGKAQLYDGAWKNMDVSVPP